MASSSAFSRVTYANSYLRSFSASRDFSFCTAALKAWNLLASTSACAANG